MAKKRKRMNFWRTLVNVLHVLRNVGWMVCLVVTVRVLAFVSPVASVSAEVFAQRGKFVELFLASLPRAFVPLDLFRVFGVVSV